ncbi:Protein containing DUF583 [Candidatus Magnetomoraceae bacterium gMMP-15]
MGKAKKKTQEVNTFLGSQTHIEGTIEFEGAIRMDGNFKGKILSNNGTVIVGQHAVINGDMIVGSVMIMGEVHGQIEANNRIEIHPPGRMIGDIQAPQVLIDPGVEFNGKCIMTNKLNNQ